jgi:malic enzyme
VRGEAYDVFVAAFVEAVGELFPHALLHWEDFGPGNGRRLLERYGDQLCTFNDDLQGTGAITLACVLNAARVSGTPLRDQRIVVFGAGTAGVGIADQLRDAMVRDGLDHEEATRRIWPRRPVEPGAALLPEVRNLRASSAVVAATVARRAAEEDVATVRLDDVIQQIQDAMWQPEYR